MCALYFTVELVKCDGVGFKCPDGHKGRVICNECLNETAFPEVD